MHCPKSTKQVSLLAPVLLMIASAPSRAEEPKDSYYMAVFSAQVESNEPRLTHTFATFMKDTGDSAKEYRTEVHTIRWMPKSLTIAILGANPEPGTNLDLQSSLRWAESRNCRVSMWGPYKIDNQLYDRAVKQESRLRSGRVLYKAIDLRFRPGVASNCIHAVSDLDTDKGLLDSGLRRGDDASRLVVQHLSRWMIDRGQKHAWVAGRLGLKIDSASLRDTEQRSLLALR
jgi:hypothetical protein